VGIPKTIDRDLCATEYTLGFDTALNVIVEEMDRLRTAGSHSRLFVVEVMGRHADWLPLGFWREKDGPGRGGLAKC